MPGNPPRHVPGRGSTRPGVRRGPRTAVPPEPEIVEAATGDTPQAHAAVRSKVISTLALGVTNRVIALAATVAVLLISFVSSFSVYLGQQQNIAQTKADIAAGQTQVANLQDELNRWQDPAYVETQAREQLGWVMPGEVGYRVIDANGNVIGGTASAAEPAQDAATTVWYDALWSSLTAADRPEPVVQTTPAVPTAPATIGPDTKPR